MVRCSLERMSEKIHTFAKFGDAGHGGITRYSLSPEALQARDYFKERMEKIGAVVTYDDVANMYATLPGSEPGLKKIVTGSHCDSVKNGGNYDGILGVIGAMEVLETIVAEKIPHRHDIVAMIWTNEEGSLYPPAMMSSGIVCHDYLPAEIAKNFEYDNMMKSVSVEDGVTTFGERLKNFKYKGDKKNRLNPDDYMCDFELHIEQGPILEDEGKIVGIVDCVLGGHRPHHPRRGRRRPVRLQPRRPARPHRGRLLGLGRPGHPRRPLRARRPPERHDHLPQHLPQGRRGLRRHRRRHPLLPLIFCAPSKMV